MNTAKKILLKLIDDIPDDKIHEVIDFIEYLKLKNKNNTIKDLEEASKSSMEFWNNDIDDEVWNKDYSIFITSEDLIEGKLKKDSCIRADKIYTLSKDIVVKKFGTVNSDISKQVKQKINEFLK